MAIDVSLRDHRRMRDSSRCCIAPVPISYRQPGPVQSLHGLHATLDQRVAAVSLLRAGAEAEALRRCMSLRSLLGAAGYRQWTCRLHARQALHVNSPKLLQFHKEVTGSGQPLFGAGLAGPKRPVSGPGCVLPDRSLAFWALRHHGQRDCSMVAQTGGRQGQSCAPSYQERSRYDE